MILKAIIVDDEQHCIDTLQWLIEKYSETVEIEKMFKSPINAVKYLQENTVDIVFLDIEMPEMNGFDLLRKVKKVEFDVIFTTAYDEFALKAFQASAIDYLLKPIDVTQFLREINKIVNKL